MTTVVEAIYSDGVLRPLQPLQIAEDQRVRLTVETIDGKSNDRREAAVDRLIDRLKRSPFSYGGPYPKRDELYDRHGNI